MRLRSNDELSKKINTWSITNLVVMTLEQLDNPKPFRNFKRTIDNSSQRTQWFDFRLNAHIKFVEKQWKEMDSGS